MNLIQKIKKNVPILIAEDDEEDREIIKEAFDECKLANDLIFVNDGEELMEYLLKKGKYAVKRQYGDPGIILLDLNMPRKDGRQALAEIKSNADLRKIPVIILTTSKEEEDIVRTYKLGVNSFVIKPVTYAALVNVMKSIGNYWFEIVELPS
ncbi:MAG TPA: response regulator [Chitinophagales bacterium]|nr:response regulator [Chitinophagales bacterium]